MAQAAATLAGLSRLRPRCINVRMGYWVIGYAVLSVSPLMAQAPDSAPQSAAAAPPGTAAVQPSPAPGNNSGGNKHAPSLSKAGASSDPAAENITWDGKTWHAIDQSLFEARFEKYLNAPEQTTADDVQYQGIVKKILELTAPGNASALNTDAALRLLPRASGFGIDARLCDSLADAISSCFRCLWTKERVDAERAAASRKAHEAEKPTPPERKMRPLLAGRSTDSSAQTQDAVPIPNFEHEAKVTTELSVIQAKVELQALIVQLFLQRRFQHVLMGTRFYRAIFTDGDAKLNLGRETKALFEKSGDMPPTVGTLESLANEAIFHVHEDVQAYEFLAKKGDLENAVKRLAQGFAVGEYLPEIGALPREMKRRALDTHRK
jgi:hypothetical protein